MLIFFTRVNVKYKHFNMASIIMLGRNPVENIFPPSTANVALSRQNLYCMLQRPLALTFLFRQVWKLHIRATKETDRDCYMCQINTERMKQQQGCVDINVPPDIDYLQTSEDVTVQVSGQAFILGGGASTSGCKSVLKIFYTHLLRA